MTLYTSPNSILRWLGIPALHNSTDLKPIKDKTTREALQLWWDEMSDSVEPDDEGPEDAA